MRRRLFLAASAASGLAACSPIGTALNANRGFHRVLTAPDALNQALIGTRGLAQTYHKSAISVDFPVESLPIPASDHYAALVTSHFHSYRLLVDGAVQRPQSFSLARLLAMAQITETTRHDCVDGWSAIAESSGPRLSDVLAIVAPLRDARYVVFHCMDQDNQQVRYYESLNMRQAAHPQTLLALRMNGSRMPVKYGAPVRLRVPTQLGYKSAKWIARIEVVGTFAHLYDGNGGYREDQGYQWYAGI